MANYEKMSTSEVQILAKQGDKNALFEMAWRLDEVLPGDYNLLERSAWNNYWSEKAAKVGHAGAKSQIAHMYYKMSYDGAAVKYRQMAMKYYQELSDDFDAGKLDEEDRDCGETAKIWLGILLCMGNGLPRDEKKGMKLIHEAEILTNNLDGFVFIPLKELGTMYEQGYARPDEVPTSSDLKKAIAYLEKSIQPPQIKHLIQEVGQNLGQALIEDVKEYLEEVREKLNNKLIEEENTIISSNVSLLNSLAEFRRLKAIERRMKKMELSHNNKKQLNDYEAAVMRLQERLAREGW